MPAEPSVLARNTSYFTLALVGQKFISFLYFTYLTRLFGPAEVGRYVFALSLTTVFSVLLDLGLASVLTREVARDPGKAERYVRLVYGYKLIAAMVVVALVAAYVWLLGYPVGARELVYLACIVMVLDSFTLSTYSVIRGFHTLTWESLGTVLYQLSVAAVGVLVSLITRDLRVFMFALIVGSGINCAYAFGRLRRVFKVEFRPRLEATGLRELARLTWPFAAAAVLTRFYGYLDTLLLSLMKGDHAVGIYSVAYKVTFALQFIPTAFSAALFPGFSSYFMTAPQKLADTFAHSVVYLTAISVPVSLGIAAIAPEVIQHVYPAYHEAVLPLQVLILSLIFLFAAFPVGALLPACNRQERNTFNIGLAAASNVVLNLVLIPRYGPTGAAVASFVSTLVLLAAGWVVARQLVAYDAAFLWSRLTRIAASGLAMCMVVFITKGSIGWLLAIPLGALVYLGLLFSLGGVTVAEARTLVQMVTRRAQAV